MIFFTISMNENVYYFRDVLQTKRLVFIEMAVQLLFWSPLSSPAKEFWRCQNDLLDNFPHVTHNKNLSHYNSLVLIYLPFEIIDKSNSNRL